MATIQNNTMLDTSKQTTMTHCCRRLLRNCRARRIRGLLLIKKLAEIINKQWSAKLPDSKLKDKYGKYLRPSNCETLTIPRVNPEIWDKLSHSAKQHDLRSSSTQKTLATVGALLCKSPELIMNVKHTQQSNVDSDLKTLLKMNTDAVAF